MASLLTYDPKSVILVVGGVPISGYADGTFVEVAREVDTFSKKTGADGYTTRIKSNNTSGTVTITLMQTSPSNDVLSGFAALDQLSNAGVVPVMVKDSSGTSINVSAQGWIRKVPDQAFGAEINTREWAIDCAELLVFVGGNS
jgi:hypothetical protein